MISDPALDHVLQSLERLLRGLWRGPDCALKVQVDLQCAVQRPLACTGAVVSSQLVCSARGAARASCVGHREPLIVRSKFKSTSSALFSGRLPAAMCSSAVSVQGCLNIAACRPWCGPARSKLRSTSSALFSNCLPAGQKPVSSCRGQPG